MNIISSAQIDRHPNLQRPEGGAPLESNHHLLDGGDIVVNESLMPHEQALDLFRQMQYEIPDVVYQQAPQNDTPENIKFRAKTLLRESKRVNDEYEEARALSRTKDVDGRPHIDGLKGNIINVHYYQELYGELVKKATEYMQDMNTALGSMSSHIKAGSDNKIYFEPGDFVEAVDKILSKYTNQEYLGGSHNDYFNGWDVPYEKTNPFLELEYSDKAFYFWVKKLDKQGFDVRQNGNKLCIYPDLKHIMAIYQFVSDSKAPWSGGNISSQEFQSLQSAIDSEKNGINSSVSRLLETFRQDNSHFETLTQLLIQLYKDLQQYNNGYLNI
ncbi:TPA: IpaD/SipD/SspD family type III secretion system needle tip protein [Providencia rettgeri]|uniref:IpaD/SipD/SspD family type III secretion system needle tip protein n=1 Tax=Providencia sp. PROV129 TaxID=2949839 RepID=UPI0023492015|nr:IpaD/SipD/SspD family type III secretion system needle tip protein [Providencia sp. PROV129]HEC8327987.1 IpaD/SipD/SspD family type III secretion system needle tip protein [Providencia rettgeri]